MSSNSILSSVFQWGRIPKDHQLNSTEAIVYWTLYVAHYEEICLRFNSSAEERPEVTMVE